MSKKICLPVNITPVCYVCALKFFLYIQQISAYIILELYHNNVTQFGGMEVEKGLWENRG